MKNNHYLSFRNFCRKLFPFCLIAMMASFIIAIIQCNDPTVESTQHSITIQKTISHKKYSVEIFPSPEEQLRYARSRFSDPEERRAALEVLIERFPEINTVRGKAELEMAYLALGPDHRFATTDVCTQSLKIYRQIIMRFSDLPAICAKAHWYTGWIHADLMNQKRLAIAHYQTIIHRYPGAKLETESPVPWVSFVMPQTKPSDATVNKRTNCHWASLALLEIIRNSDQEEEKWRAFQTLWSDYHDSLATGHALCALLRERTAISQKVAGNAKYYLENQNLRQSLAEEIRISLKNLPLASGSSSIVKDTDAP